MEFQNVTVIGAGLMGSGIAYVTAVSGRNVTIVDQEQQFVDAGMSKIKDQIKDGINRGKMSPHEGQQLSQRFKSTVNLEEAVADSDLVIEAVFENMEVKKKIFSDLSKFTKSECILASNTSTLSITEIASVTEKPDKVVGLHFFSPVAAMKLVEIIKGDKTADSTMNQIEAFSDTIGKTSVRCSDSPGFIVNRIVIPLLNEAVKLLDSGGVTAEDIDKACVLGLNFPVGPLTLADYTGIDIALAGLQTLEREFGSCYKPSDTLVKMVEDGKLGMKTKEGFYKY
ncbi:MAG: putative 3-hydroxybutyryl-CoA dehydrogenase [Candidatus Heimdallarchaeota archaeon LC_2]|nr:MAG: putative 3-hydroxybutyryl-CoA dehydrogenase [Candidatus Heimdallarchaeota archaeon LC_2]